MNDDMPLPRQTKMIGGRIAVFHRGSWELTSLACDACSFWFRSRRSEYGQCHAGPPKFGDRWPVTHASEYCGAFDPPVYLSQPAVNPNE